MPIQAGDIKLVASQVMDDVPEGGGAPTSTVILDGQSNAVFPDISELDRAGGRVNLRKLHMTVQTTDTDTYLGSNIIVAEPPTDPNVSITLFSTKSTFDVRDDAANMIESYLIKGTIWSGFLLENHVVGQRVIQLFQRPATPDPTIGHTIVLVYREGLSDEVEQYVRVIRTESVVDTYTNADGKQYQGKVVTCEISDALRSSFKGSSPNDSFSASSDKTLTRDTTAANAGSYFGVVPLTTALTLGASTAQCRSVYTQLVPSAATEKIALDILPSATRTVVAATSPRRVEIGVAPHSLRVKINQDNRGYSYVQILRPLPSPGTLDVSFLALGKWYTLTDDGAGNLTGDGAGTVNYLTGTVSVTLPVLPDVSGSLIFAWGETTAYQSHAGQATFRAPEFSFDLSKKGIDPGSLTVTWLSGGVLKTAVANAAGNLSGHATGFLSNTHGMLTIKPAFMLDAGGEFNLTYTWSPVVTETKAGVTASSGGLCTFSLDQVPVEGSILVEWFTTRTISATAGSSLSAGSSSKNTSTTSGSTSAQAITTKTTHIPAQSYLAYYYS